MVQVSTDSEVVLHPAWEGLPPPLPTHFKPTYTMGAVSNTFHIFLSHVWGTGQDQMRIVKQRLHEMVPSLQIFLDVDECAAH